MTAFLVLLFLFSGQSPIKDQDSFQYRDEHGVKSLQLDDDNCERDSSLSLGHAMCFADVEFPENVFGVDLLFDSTSISPSPNNGLYIYFKGILCNCSL